MAQKQVIDANLMYKIGVASKADPMAKAEAEKRKERKERMRNYLLSAGKLAMNFYIQGQQYASKLMSESGPLLSALDTQQIKSKLIDNMDVANVIEGAHEQLNDYTKTMKRNRLNVTGETYRNASQGRSALMEKIKNLTSTTDNLVLLQEQYGKDFSEWSGISRYAEDFLSVYSGLDKSSAPPIFEHNSQEQIRNAWLIASGEYTKHTYLDPETLEYKIRLEMPSEEGADPVIQEMTMTEFTNSLALRGDSTIGELSLRGVDEIIGNNYQVDIDKVKEDYFGRVTEIFNNEKLVNTNTFKTWLSNGVFTYTDNDGELVTTNPIHYIAEEIMSEAGWDLVGQPGQPGPVDIESTPNVDESKLTVEYNDSMLTYSGLVDEIKNMKFLRPNDRKKGVELYMMMIESKHNRLNSIYEDQLSKQEENKRKTATSWMVGGSWVPVSDVRDAAAAIESNKDFDFIEIPWTSKNTPWSAMRRVDGVYQLLSSKKGRWKDMDDAVDAARNLDIFKRVNFGKNNVEGEAELD